MSDENYKNLCEILKNIDCKWICIDIANGYLNQFVEYCKKVRNIQSYYCCWKCNT